MTSGGNNFNHFAENQQTKFSASHPTNQTLTKYSETEILQNRQDIHDWISQNIRTHVLLGVSSLTTGVVFSFQSSMTFIDKQQWIQNARINHNLLYISTQCALTGEIVIQLKQNQNQHRSHCIKTKRELRKSRLAVEIEIQHNVTCSSYHIISYALLWHPTKRIWNYKDYKIQWPMSGAYIWDDSVYVFI